MSVTNRYLAFLIHISISFLLFVMLALIIKFVWFPGVLFETDGGWDGIKLIIGVDLVIGPLLTLLVYNVKKPELRRDLAMIGLLQLLCVTGGMAVVEYVRPVAVIYANSTFFTASRQRFEEVKVDIASLPLLQGTKPVWVSVKLPKERAEKSIIYMQAKALGGLDMSTDLYQPYREGLSALAEEGSTGADAAAKGLAVADEWMNDKQVRIYNLRTRYAMTQVAVDVTTGEILGLVKKK